LGTSINEESSLEEFTLYPNPTNSIATLLFNRKSNTSEKAILQIMDLTGRVVSPEQNILLTAGVQQVPMDCSGLQPGVYLVRLISGTQQITVRLIRQ
jgi:precorrin-6x reductase